MTCSPAYSARRTGHPASDRSMFSFAPIKAATALGGAVLCFEDASLAARARHEINAYRRQRGVA
jgi:perosamine synthetase